MWLRRPGGHSEVMADTATESGTAGRRITWARAGVATVIIGTLALWLYAFLWPQPLFGRLEDTTFPTAAEPVCAEARAAIDALPRAEQARDNVDRADTLDTANAKLDTMLTRLEALPRGNDKAARSVGEWLDDWRQYLTDRKAYAAQLRSDRTTRFTVTQSQRDKAQITQSVDRFANVNRMGSCATPVDVA